jgi:hypothetical protein
MNFEQMEQLVLNDPEEFFKGKKVSIDLVWDNKTLRVNFYAENGTVFVKGAFERASAVAVDLSEALKVLGVQKCYETALKAILPHGLKMVLDDYPEACKRLKEDLEDLNKKISKILNEISSTDIKEDIMVRVLEVCKEKEKLSKKKIYEIYQDAVIKIEKKMKSLAVTEIEKKMKSLAVTKIEKSEVTGTNAEQDEGENGDDEEGTDDDDE